MPSGLSGGIGSGDFAVDRSLSSGDDGGVTRRGALNRREPCSPRWVTADTLMGVEAGLAVGRPERPGHDASPAQPSIARTALVFPPPSRHGRFPNDRRRLSARRGPGTRGEGTREEDGALDVTDEADRGARGTGTRAGARHPGLQRVRPAHRAGCGGSQRGHADRPRGRGRPRAVRARRPADPRHPVRIAGGPEPGPADLHGLPPPRRQQSPRLVLLRGRRPGREDPLQHPRVVTGRLHDRGPVLLPGCDAHGGLRGRQRGVRTRDPEADHPVRGGHPRRGRSTRRHRAHEHRPELSGSAPGRGRPAPRCNPDGSGPKRNGPGEAAGPRRMGGQGVAAAVLGLLDPPPR